MKKIITCLAAIMFVTVSFAQEERSQQRQRREFNPEGFAMMQTSRLNEVLALDSMQFQAIFLMNYADAMTMQDSINARRQRNEQMRKEGRTPERTRLSEEQMKAMMELQKQREQVRNEQMKVILTLEQYEQYLKHVEEQRKNMRRGRGNRMPRK
jgi:hypothetical protein